MNEDIQKRLTEIEARLAKIEAKVKKDEIDTIHYIEQHSDYHLELSKMIYPSYFKTHPGYCNTIDQIHDVMHKKSSGSDDKKD